MQGKSQEFPQCASDRSNEKGQESNEKGTVSSIQGQGSASYRTE